MVADPAEYTCPIGKVCPEGSPAPGDCPDGTFTDEAGR